MKSTKEQHTRLLPKAWVLHPSSQGLVSQPYRRFLVSFTFNWRKTKGKECAPLFFFNEREINKATKRSQVLSERFMCCSSLFIYKRMKEAREMNKERTQHQSHTAAVTFWNSLKAQVKEEKWSERVRNERRERHTPFTSFPSFHFAFHLIGCYCGPCFVVFKLKRKESTHSFLTCLSFAFI